MKWTLDRSNNPTNECDVPAWVQQGGGDAASSCTGNCRRATRARTCRSNWGGLCGQMLSPADVVRKSRVQEGVDVEGAACGGWTGEGEELKWKVERLGIGGVVAGLGSVVVQRGRR